MKELCFKKACPKSSVLFNSREDMHAVEEGKTQSVGQRFQQDVKKSFKKKREEAEISSCPKAT